MARRSSNAMPGPSGPNRRIQELDKQNGARGSRHRTSCSLGGENRLSTAKASGF